MRGFLEQELIDVVELGLADANDPGDFTTPRRNANTLVELLNRRHTESALGHPPAPLVLYFPSGRYLIGRPSIPMDLGGPLVHDPDIYFPVDITLKFAAGAQVVPMGYADANGELISAARDSGGERSIEGLQKSEFYKVRIVVEGCIEAGIYPIFDALVHKDLETDTIQEAGRILLRGNATRAVYPEWWNAVPLVNEEIPSPPRVRRTTVALQMALDAAFNRRIPSIRGPGGSLPSVPVMLVNDYAIDRPLRIGATMAQSRGRDRSDEDAPANVDYGMILRGECGPATRRFGAALIKASEHFIPSRAPSDSYEEVSTMLALRTKTGVTVQNVVFDANERAERCVTLSLSGGRMASHHGGFEGCEFRNARRTLVHIGGEIVLGHAPPEHINGGQPYADVSSLADTADQDLSGLRFVRCRFETGTPANVEATAAQVRAERLPRDKLPITEPVSNPVVPGYWRLGVLFHANESLPVAFHGCVFLGPANPMILGLGGRLSLQNCAFRTDLVPSLNGPGDTTDSQFRQWNGTDFLCALALAEHGFEQGLQPQPHGATSLTARHVESRSRQFLSTFEWPLSANAKIFSSITLIHVRHASDFSTTPDDLQRPAIYWGGPHVNNNTALVLMGCVFGDRRGESPASGGVYVDARADNPIAPVVDLGSRRTRGAEVLTGPRSAAVRNVLRLGSTAARAARR